MKKTMIKLVVALMVISLVLAGCEELPVDEVAKTMEEQDTQKKEQSANMMKAVGTPKFNYSVERENISKRLTVTNDANLLQWIYPMSAGRVIGRFPVRGKVTSGSKRLTSTQMFKEDVDIGDSWGDVLVEAPDEMGAYGSSGDYIFWFDPSGQYHQHSGNYFLSTEPYKLDQGFGTISTEIDELEEAKISEYDKQTSEVIK